MTGRERVRAFGPGRVNLIGEHTDYNDGLALPFAIADGVTVSATKIAGDEIHAHALDSDEHDAFALEQPARAPGWRAFVRGAVAELRACGLDVGCCSRTSTRRCSRPSSSGCSGAA